MNTETVSTESKKNNLEAMWQIVDHWTKPGAPVPEDKALKMLDELEEIMDKAFEIFKDDQQDIEVRLKACEIVRTVVDFKLSLATGRRELNIVPSMDKERVVDAVRRSGIIV